MTTFEAAHLVLEAAAIGRGGEIFVLEMGQPVRIEDLARKMILLSGVDPEQVRIEFSGVRPGEKLFEELSAYEEDTVSTRHPQIRSFTGPKLSLAGLGSGLEALRSALDGEDAEGVVECLKELAPDYRPSGFLLERSAPLKAGRVYA
jgi:FlaA1/EpsC-like NDP-sugar epimerase